jgi:hypothetical protein
MAGVLFGCDSQLTTPANDTLPAPPLFALYPNAEITLQGNEYSAISPPEIAGEECQWIVDGHAMVTAWSRPDCEAVHGVTMWIEYTAWLTPGVWRIGLNAINTGAGLGDDPTWYPEFHVASSLTPEVIRIPASDTEVNYGYTQYRVSSAGYYTVRYWWLNDNWDWGEPPRDANIKIASAFFDRTQGGGAIVSNPGEGKPDGLCFFNDDDGYYTTTKVTTVQSPNGKGTSTLSCQFKGLPPIPKARRLTGWTCRIDQGGVFVTNNSVWVRTPSGNAQVTCQYDGEPAFDAAVVFDSETRPAIEGAFTRPLIDFPGARISGEVVDIGRACIGDPLLGDPAGKVALIVRGVCRFDEKIGNAILAGAIAAVVYNDAARGDALVRMGGDPRPIPGVFVGHSTGMAVRDAAPVTATLKSCRNTRANLNGCN